MSERRTASTPRRKLQSAAFALVRANGIYWPEIAPAVHAELKRWERLARGIPNAPLRTIALRKLSEERFNIQAAATLATIAPRDARKHALVAIVALQAAYDYLDLLTEQPLAGLPDSRHLLQALVYAVGSEPADSQETASIWDGDGGYLRALVLTVRTNAVRLPAFAAINTVTETSARRCVQAQALIHAADIHRRAGEEQAAIGREDEQERWARKQAATTPLRWVELLAGASASVLCLHALIAAAASPESSRGEARRLDRLYLSIAALTMLDSFVDADSDRVQGQQNYFARYHSEQEMADRLATIARLAADEASQLPYGAHHRVMIAGIVAFYETAAKNGDDAAATGDVVFARLRGELGSLLLATRTVMRIWRSAERARHRLRAGSSGERISSPQVAQPLHDGIERVGEGSREAE